MNYAEKELREAMDYLEAARTQENTLKLMLRALELDEPVEVSFRTAKGAVTSLCPTKTGTKLVYALLDRVSSRISNLEKQEVYWCEEVANVNKQEKLNTELRLRPDLSLNMLRGEDSPAPASTPHPTV